MSIRLILTILTACLMHTANGQITPASFFVSCDLSFDKTQFYLIAPRIGFFVSDRDALGLHYSYSAADKFSHLSLISLFYRRHLSVSENTLLFIEPSLAAGSGQGSNLPGEKLYNARVGNAALRAGLLLFLTPGLSAELIPFALVYRHEQYTGKIAQTREGFSGSLSVGSQIGINIHLAKKTKEQLGKPGHLTDKKILSGGLTIVHNGNHGFTSLQQFSFSPRIGIFMTNAIEIGMSMSLVSSSQSALDITSRYNEKYSSTSFQLGPQVRFYQWLNPRTGLFIQGSLEGAFIFSRTDQQHAHYTNRRIDPYGGVYIGFCSFINSHILLEASTNLYSFEQNRFSPMLNQMKISLGFLVGGGQSRE